ncbi:MAG: cobalamin-dependent protein [Ahrensia sp.]|nr:cobalamin-dependent protein [Ahrensia sp.]
MSDPNNTMGNSGNGQSSNQKRDNDDFTGFSLGSTKTCALDGASLLRAVGDVSHKMSAAHSPEICDMVGVSAQTLLKAVIDGDRKFLSAMVDQLLDKNIGLDMLYDQLLLPVSADLNEMWRDDRIGFVDVEMATARLQMMCNLFAIRFSATQHKVDTAKRIILARVRGERHALGLSIVEVFFRHAGWIVDGGTSLETSSAFYGQIKEVHYDVVGISVGAATVADVSDTISHIRSSSFNDNVKIALGGPAIACNPRNYLPAGADLLTADIKTAVERVNLLLAAG